MNIHPTLARPSWINIHNPTCTTARLMFIYACPFPVGWDSFLLMFADIWEHRDDQNMLIVFFEDLKKVTILLYLSCLHISWHFFYELTHGVFLKKSPLVSSQLADENRYEMILCGFCLTGILLKLKMQTWEIGGTCLGSQGSWKYVLEKTDVHL